MTDKRTDYGVRSFSKVKSSQTETFEKAKETNTKISKIGSNFKKIPGRKR